MPTLRSKLRSVTPPPVRAGGTRDTDVTATHGTVTATLAVDAHDRGELRLDSAAFTLRTSGLITDLLALEADHGEPAARDAAVALCKAITTAFGVTLK